MGKPANILWLFSIAIRDTLNYQRATKVGSRLSQVTTGNSDDSPRQQIPAPNVTSRSQGAHGARSPGARSAGSPGTWGKLGESLSTWLVLRVLLGPLGYLGWPYIYLDNPQVAVLTTGMWLNTTCPTTCEIWTNFFKMNNMGNGPGQTLHGKSKEEPLVLPHKKALSDQNNRFWVSCMASHETPWTLSARCGEHRSQKKRAARIEWFNISQPGPLQDVMCRKKQGIQSTVKAAHLTLELPVQLCHLKEDDAVSGFNTCRLWVSYAYIT